MTLLVSGADKQAARRAQMQLTPRQLFIGLAAAGFISDEEAIAAATLGTLPATVETAIGSLTPAKQVAARITWARMGVVMRNDPLVAMLAEIAGQTDAQIDTFFDTFSNI